MDMWKCKYCGQVFEYDPVEDPECPKCGVRKGLTLLPAVEAEKYKQQREIQEATREAQEAAKYRDELRSREQLMSDVSTIKMWITFIGVVILIQLILDFAIGFGIGFSATSGW